MMSSLSVSRGSRGITISGTLDVPEDLNLDTAQGQAQFVVFMKQVSGEIETAVAILLAQPDSQHVGSYF